MLNPTNSTDEATRQRLRVEAAMRKLSARRFAAALVNEAIAPDDVAARATSDCCSRGPYRGPESQAEGLARPSRSDLHHRKELLR